MINFDDLLKRVFEIPQEIKANELKLYGLTVKKISLNNQLKKLKDKHIVGVYNENKESKKFTDAEVRKVEADNRYLADKDLQIWLEALEKAEYDFNLTEVEIDYLKREFKAIEFVIEINKSRVKFT